MIVHPMPWREVQAGMTVVAPGGALVVAPSSWPSDAIANVVLVDELEAATNLRAAGFTWQLITTEETQ